MQGAMALWAEGCGIALTGDEYMPPKAAIKWRRQAPYLASAAILYNYPGRSPQPVRKALADSGQNPGGPGP